MSFNSLIGQKELKALLASEASCRHSGSFMFTGEAGSGKHLFAEEFAKALMCEHPGRDGACGECSCCHYFEGKTTPDIKRIDVPKDTKNIKVEDIRTSVVAESALRPQFSRNKVFIINLDYVATEGQNALLKSIEEPQQNVVFLLLSSNPENVLSTVKSRTTELKIARYTEDDIYRILRQKEAPGDEGSLRTICGLCSGVPGMALKMAGDETYLDLYKETVDMVLSLGSDSLTEILTVKNRFWADNKQNVGLISEIVLRVLGDIIKYSVYPDRPSPTGETEQIRLFALKHKNIDSIAIGRCSDAVIAFRKELEVNCNFDGACCALMLRIHEEFTR